MKTFEYRLYTSKEQYQRLLVCLNDSRNLYNEMLEIVKETYYQTGKILRKYDLNKEFKGRGANSVPSSSVQCLADRLDKGFSRFFQYRELGIKAGFPRFKSNRQWRSIDLRQYGKWEDAEITKDQRYLRIPRKLGGLVKIKMHRPLEGRPKTTHLVLRADGYWYALIVCETEPHLSSTLAF